jgi:hypothetical protein
MLTAGAWRRLGLALLVCLPLTLGVGWALA